MRGARRGKRDLMLIYADIDGLKKINDFGHEAGSQAIRRATDVFKQTFAVLTALLEDLIADADRKGFWSRMKEAFRAG